MTAPTPAQVAARDRNWRIFRLRALWYQVSLLSRERSDECQMIIDSELITMGALPEEEHRQKRRAELEARLNREQEIPF